MTHGFCCGDARTLRMVSQAKKAQEENAAAAAAPVMAKGSLKQEKANANKFQDKIKQFTSLSFKSKKDQKA